MVYNKFSFFCLVLIFSVSAFGQTRFLPKSCLDATYKMKLTQKGPLFGLLKQELVIDKKGCLIHISHKKYFPHEWMLDVCREPVHIKVTSATGVDVAKKENDCIKNDNSKDTSHFCSQYFELLDILQDDGLIFAEGDRDNLSSDHGKTFCSYLLIKKYLNESVVFSRYTEVEDIFIEKPKLAPAPLAPAPALRPEAEDNQSAAPAQEKKAEATIPITTATF
jgi:hypothetical protein